MTLPRQPKLCQGEFLRFEMFIDELTTAVYRVWRRLQRGAPPAKKDHIGITTMFLSPSMVHFIHGEGQTIISHSIDMSILDVSRKIMQNGDYPKIQVVEKEGHWFTLNNSQLELCRRLEREGTCSRVKVDVVPITEVPEDVRRMMVVPPKCPDKLLVEKEPDTKTKKPSTESDQSRSTGRGYQKLDQGEQSDQEKEQTSDSECSSSGDSDFDESDSECDWSQEDGDSSECDSSDDDNSDKSTDDERECLL